ncbi:hypothetical protein L1049_004362 [Liquidambar formosana]|uniref:Uncharacterized protein n=1 Tax=Liquidambar formosana TaxID=63359 RepID=A0AAP0RN56_LIQFO
MGYNKHARLPHSKTVHLAPHLSVATTTTICEPPPLPLPPPLHAVKSPFTTVSARGLKIIGRTVQMHDSDARLVPPRFEACHCLALGMGGVGNMKDKVCEGDVPLGISMLKRGKA